MLTPDKSKIKIRKLTIEQRRLIPVRYKNGERAVDIAKSLHVDFTLIYQYLKVTKTEIRPRYERHRRYSLDASFFDVIDNELKAYWLGFLAADGSITSETRLQVTLAIKDIEHLYALRQALKSNQPIHVYSITTPNNKDRQYARLCIRSTPLTQGLIANGVTPRKTHTLQFPKHLPDELIHHFIRGYVDGDGSLLIFKSGEIGFSLIGNHKFLQNVQAVLVQRCRLNPTKIEIKHGRTPNIRTLRYGGRRQVRRIVDFLYKDATVYLNRKMDRVQPLLKLKRNFTNP